MRGICCSVGICTPAVAPSATASASADIGRFFWRDISFCLPFDLAGRQLTVSIIPKQPTTVNWLLGICLPDDKEKMSTAARDKQATCWRRACAVRLCDFQPEPKHEHEHEHEGSQGADVPLGIWQSCCCSSGWLWLLCHRHFSNFSAYAVSCKRLCKSRAGVALRQSVRLHSWRLLSQNIINVQFIFGLRLCHPHGKEMLLWLTRSAADLRGKGQLQQQ